MDDFAENFLQHYRTCLHVFRAVSDKCETVSPIFQIGLTFLPSGASATGVIDSHSPPEERLSLVNYAV